MIGRYWIKLWLDILQDRKMAMLPDRYWRRFVELLLIAKAEHEAGLLPELFWMARQVGLSQEELEADLVELAKAGLVAQRDGRWLIPNFAKRQEPATGTSAAGRKQRERQWQVMSQAGHKPVTSFDRGRGEEESEGESEGESEAEKLPPTPPKEHPSMLIFREKAHLWPPKSWRSEIVSTVGDEPASHERWGTLVHEWVGRGWKPTNVSGMLEAFRAGGIQDRREGKAAVSKIDDWAAREKAKRGEH